MISFKIPDVYFPYLIVLLLLLHDSSCFVCFLLMMRPLYVYVEMEVYTTSLSSAYFRMSGGGHGEIWKGKTSLENV